MFDPDLVWTFYIELVKIQKAEPHKKYPIIARKEGEAPKQYKLKGKLPGATANLTEYDKMADMLIASRMMDEIISDDDDLDTEDLEIEDIIPEIPNLIIPEKIALPSIKRIPVDLKFDDEELTVDSDDLELLEGEEGDEEEKNLDEDDDLSFEDLGGYGGSDDNNEDY